MKNIFLAILILVTGCCLIAGCDNSCENEICPTTEK